MLKKLNKGFTLLELLLSVAVISALAVLSPPVYRPFLKKNDLDIAAVPFAQPARRAQVLSQAVDSDTTWGVKAQSGSIVIFKGASFTSRDSSFDETFGVPTSIGVSGTTETVFTKFTGFPQAIGTMNVSTESDSRSVTINNKGMVNY